MHKDLLALTQSPVDEGKAHLECRDNVLSRYVFRYHTSVMVGRIQTHGIADIVAYGENVFDSSIPQGLGIFA